MTPPARACFDAATFLVTTLAVAVTSCSGPSTGPDTPTTNPQSVTSMAGIEASYADIKNTTIPAASF
jgi:hypothetical protein